MMAIHCLTALKTCQKHSWCIASGYTFVNALILLQSLSECVTFASIFHLSQKCFSHIISAASLLPLLGASLTLDHTKHNPNGIPNPCASPSNTNSSQLPIVHFP